VIDGGRVHYSYYDPGPVILGKLANMTLGVPQLISSQWFATTE
jgi:hypothetical protein